MSDPKYKVGDIVRFAGAICEVIACKDYTPPITIYRDCCSANRVCYTYDLKYSDGVNFGYNVSEDEISPTEEEGEYEMAKRYKFAANSLVRLKKNNALGKIIWRWRDDHDLGVPVNMYSVQFNSLSGESDIIDKISGEFKESDLEKPSFENVMSPDRGRDITGVICYIPKRSDTEFVSIDFGPKYICIDSFMPEVPMNLTLASCDDDSIVETCSEKICLIDEAMVDKDTVRKLRISLMKGKKKEEKPEEDNECPKLVIDEEYRIDPYKFLIHEIVRYTGPTKISPEEEKYEVMDRMRLCNCNYYELKGYNTNKRVKDPISGVDILIVEANLDSAAKSIKSDDRFKFNIEDHVHYNGDEFPKANYIIADRKTLFGRKFYRVKAEDMIHSYYTTWLRESDFTPATTEEESEKKSEPFFKSGDTVCYCGDGDEELYPKSDRYEISTWIKVKGKYYYALKAPNGSRVISDKESRYFREEDLDYIKAEEPVQDTKDEDFHYDIDDHVWFMGHEHIVVRKMHVGLNKYYKIRLTSETDDKHDYIVSEYALDKDPLNQPPKNEFHPTSEMSLYDHLMNAIGEGGFKPTKEVDNRDKTSIIPDVLDTYRMYPMGVHIYDLGLGEIAPQDADITVMVSQPLSDIPRSEIENTRYLAIYDFALSLNVGIRDHKDIVVVDNLQFDRKPTPEEGELNHFDYLSTDIKLMKDIDYIIFASGWQNSKGCNIEYQMAKTYGIPMWFA